MSSALRKTDRIPDVESQFSPTTRDLVARLRREHHALIATDTSDRPNSPGGHQSTPQLPPHTNSGSGTTTSSSTNNHTKESFQLESFILDPKAREDDEPHQGISRGKSPQHSDYLMGGSTSSPAKSSSVRTSSSLPQLPSIAGSQSGSTTTTSVLGRRGRLSEVHTVSEGTSDTASAITYQTHTSATSLTPGQSLLGRPGSPTMGNSPFLPSASPQSISTSYQASTSVTNLSPKSANLLAAVSPKIIVHNNSPSVSPHSSPNLSPRSAQATTANSDSPRTHYTTPQFQQQQQQQLQQLPPKPLSLTMSLSDLSQTPFFHQTLQYVKKFPFNRSLADPAKITALLPPQADEHKGRVTLVLDLDETLIHTKLDPEDEEQEDIPLYINARGEEAIIYVSFRPGVVDFLRWCVRQFEVVIFTASEEQYASAVIYELELAVGTQFLRLYRQHCTRYQPGKPLTESIRPGEAAAAREQHESTSMNNNMNGSMMSASGASSSSAHTLHTVGEVMISLPPATATAHPTAQTSTTVQFTSTHGTHNHHVQQHQHQQQQPPALPKVQYIKDLALLGRPLDRIVIMDNMEISYALQRRNAIPIVSYYGHNPDDRHLHATIPILESLAGSGQNNNRDVYSVLDPHTAAELCYKQLERQQRQQQIDAIAQQQRALSLQGQQHPQYHLLPPLHPTTNNNNTSQQQQHLTTATNNNSPSSHYQQMQQQQSNQMMQISHMQQQQMHYQQQMQHQQQVQHQHHQQQNPYHHHHLPPQQHFLGVPPQ